MNSFNIVKSSFSFTNEPLCFLNKTEIQKLNLEKGEILLISYQNSNTIALLMENNSIKNGEIWLTPAILKNISSKIGEKVSLIKMGEMFSSEKILLKVIKGSVEKKELKRVFDLCFPLQVEKYIYIKESIYEVQKILINSIEYLYGITDEKTIVEFI